ncbi:Putative E3 ubiquitin-protein ligase RNF14 [Podospora comata]|uniref:RBR-type E3 ubiquitin transferase n=1 Tax=Podospora comata TaxID=48703 RepID=A0ABY6S397_PODCO|nr:Putative E3 ubiquitin-protein ligase RNF14 [Podospora comata]
MAETERDTELQTLEAIFPEIQTPNKDDPYTIALELPVTPSKPVIVYFPTASNDGPPPDPTVGRAPNGVNPHAGPAIAGGRQQGEPQVDSHELAHLPSIRLELSFGPRYPQEEPPKVSISTNPPWLPSETIKKLQDDGPRLWEDMGRDMVGFSYIDHIQQAAEEIFGLVGDGDALEVDPSHRIAILDYDIRARRAAFEKETFECGVCLDPKKGAFCHKMMDCGHVFCVECLQDFYNSAIKEGNLAAVKCPAPNCAKERGKSRSPSGRKRKKPKVFISPSELLQIPIDEDTVRRYVTLKYKTELESDKNTIYCPRQWCNGAARSKKHKRPTGLELADALEDDESSTSEDDDDDDDNEETPEGEVGKSKPYNKTEDLLSICDTCSFAFCSRCMQSWHGEFVGCRRPKEELTAEELATIEYMKAHTTPCPTCAAPAQKTHGCNHMICYRCQTHFCYLCSAWLDPGNPYQHFNTAPDGRVTSCFMRLWELELGDGADVGYGFAGGGAGRWCLMRGLSSLFLRLRRLRMGRRRGGEEGEDQGVRGRPAVAAPVQQPPLRPPAPQQPAGGPVQEVGIAREGPLVLRIAANNPAPAAPAPVPAQGWGNNAGVAAARGGPRGRQGAGGALAARGGRGGVHRGGHQQRGGGGGRGGRGGGHAGFGPGGQGGHNRGGGRGGGGGGHRQNVNNQAQQGQRRNNNQNNQNQAGAGGGEHNMVEMVEMLDGNGELDPRQEEWVRRFVRLALNDEEDDFNEDDFDFVVPR